MKVSSVKPQFEEGQFWARPNPLGLMEVKGVFYYGDEQSIPASVEFKTWSPARIVNSESYVTPVLELVYLWARTLLPLKLFNEEPRCGDVWMDLKSEELFFVGPQDGVPNEMVRVHSDWKFRRAFLGIQQENGLVYPWVVKIQSGPSPEGLTRLEHLLDVSV